MSIEKSSTSPSAKAVTGADTHGKKAGKTPDSSGSNGFSALMSMLSAAEDVADVSVVGSVLAEVPLAGQPGAQPEVVVPVGSAGLLAVALSLVPLVPTVESDTALATATATATVLASALPQVAIPVAATSTTGLSVPTPAPVSAAATANAGSPSTSAALFERPATGLIQGSDQVQAAPLTEVTQNLLQAVEVVPSVIGIPSPQPLAVPRGSSDTNPAAGQQAKAGEPVAQQMVVLRHAAIVAASEGNAVASNAPDMSQVSPVSVLLAHRSVMQAHGVQVAQQDLKDTRAAAASQLTAAVADVLTTAVVGVAGDFVQAQGRFGARSGLGQSGSSGFESAFGQAMAATHRSDAVFEVPPASAVVADTAVAETVSYWASQGVQTAELELEGFGDSPVEVSIVLNGDQAQIDFRTDQAGVRQVLEAATAQLKELLSNQGLQLSGVSVGTSGKGNEQGSERRARQGAQQATLVKTEAVGSTSTRTANPAVGRSLDLFV